ncbi:MAG: hypothetical protein A3J46_05640 [Candidatus Yanofskybacteria bacterium RIFCSPHIGHO2_02_FULL_41_11]|uniref:NAD kinase n=1 Tax=Candidatus Yanofskybacteria bacterium RIFCSPHIGHO2_02_FULL_41_11 TaxID=1802675 RepID=A0A1F8F715_9BACT|nr:MAG: hypothetical protein A3J46_05640 [Candidatus Yanofskybacteria bacterium RIFCSPHIGHO2_02_FULL_41_11]
MEMPTIIQNPKNVSIFYHSSNKRAVVWSGKIKQWLKKKYPGINITSNKPDVIIVLGGDGTILEAAKRYHHISNPTIFGLNLGNIGYLASVRDPSHFMDSLTLFFKGQFTISERMMINVEIVRDNKKIFSEEVLNEVVVQSVLSVVDLEVVVSGINIRKIRGSGVLIATATGSTAYNLSAHGPIVMPDIKCLIVTELMDHDVPTPSIVVKYDKEVVIKVKSFRQKGILSISKSKKKVDVVLAADGNKIFPLKQGDVVIIKNSSHLIKLAEMEKNYFFKSLKSNFSVR